MLVASSASSCPADFPHAGNDAAGIWSAGENTGACGSNKDFPSALQNSVFCFDGKGGIDADLSRAPSDRDTRACMSFGTSLCPMEKDSIKEIQFVASSSGCFNESMNSAGQVWACPLWLTPQQWIPPQKSSGEIDFIERCGGNGHGNGMAMNFGSGAGSNQSSFPIPGDISEPGVFYYKFNTPSHGGDDSVDAWKCAGDANPIQHGTAGCTHIGTNRGYYARTQHGDQMANVFHLVTDIWNTQTAQSGYCRSSGTDNRSCKYRVNGIRTTFYKPPAWGSDSACHVLLLANKSVSITV
jgi:hypothetical protein